MDISGIDVKRRTLPAITTAIIATEFCIFMIELVIPARYLELFVQMFGFHLLTLNPLSPLTTLFLHKDIFHLIANISFLWLFGAPLEERIGRSNFLKYYFGAGLWSIALWTVLEVYKNPLSRSFAIGSSGAISGIIAVYVLRCYFSNVKLSVPFTQRAIHIPVVLLIIFWFSRDMLGGIAALQDYRPLEIAALSHGSSLAYWGHIGGYCFGFFAAVRGRHLSDADMEIARLSMSKALVDDAALQEPGFATRMEDLIKRMPADPAPYYYLARYYRLNNMPEEARENYHSSAFHYLTKKKEEGANVVLEYYLNYQKPLSAQLHVKASEVLISNCRLEDAYDVLKPFVGTGLAGPIAERAHVQFIKVCLALQRNEEARAALGLFKEQYEKSRYHAELSRALLDDPKTIFPQAMIKVPPRAVTRNEPDRKKAVKGGPLTGFIEFITEDKVFVKIWVVLQFTLDMPANAGFDVKLRYTQLVSFVLAFGTASLFRYFRTQNEQEVAAAGKEADMSTMLSRAGLAERSENYSTAAAHYEQYLIDARDDLQARFNLARIYHKKLNQPGKAIRHYEHIYRTLDKEHHYRVEAQNALWELKQRGR